MPAPKPLSSSINSVYNTLDFEDHFDGGELDSQRWVAHYLPHMDHSGCGYRIFSPARGLARLAPLVGSTDTASICPSVPRNRHDGSTHRPEGG